MDLVFYLLIIKDNDVVILSMSATCFTCWTCISYCCQVYLFNMSLF